MNNAYYPIPYKSTILEDINMYINGLDNNSWNKYYNFNVSQLPNEIVYKDSVLKHLIDQIDLQVGILKMDPYTCYNWHIDTDRIVGINMLIHHNNSKCLFTQNSNEVTFPIHELNYQPETYYIFNTKIPHCVINFDGYRYMLSLEFIDKNKIITFNQLTEMFK